MMISIISKHSWVSLMPPAPVGSDQMFTAYDKNLCLYNSLMSYCRTNLMVNLKQACTENFNVDATVCRGAVTSTAFWIYNDLSNFWDMSWNSVWITCVLQGNSTLQQKTSIVAEIFATRWITKYHVVIMSTNSWQHFTNCCMFSSG
jgi:hypothetical protein